MELVEVVVVVVVVVEVMRIGMGVKMGLEMVLVLLCYQRRIIAASCVQGRRVSAAQRTARPGSACSRI